MNISAKHSAIEVEVHGNFVDGREIEAGAGQMLDIRNPATGDVIARIPNSTAEDIDRAMQSARAAFEGKAWGGMDIRSRARLVNRLADVSRPIWTRCTASKPSTTAARSTRRGRNSRGCRISSATLRDWRCRAATRSFPSKARI
jgi:hypothetical protein